MPHQIRSPVDGPFEQHRDGYAIEWPGTYRIDEDLFSYFDEVSDTVTRIMGYSTEQLRQAGLG
ncbi:MAG: hypothetical protein U0Q16_03700 [Bryobacteraceae bacterium]